MLAVTTFPPWAWDMYAEKCVRSMVECWPGSILAFYEGVAPPPLAGVEFRPLDEIEARTEFLNRNVPPPPNYLYDVKRFCHKVFAQLQCMYEHPEFYWIDADMMCLAEIPQALVETQIKDVPYCYLGRDSYTETGLIGFNCNHPGFDDFADRYEAMYTEGDIFRQPLWTDCHAFDAARTEKGNNLTPKGRGFDNVIEDSVFGEYLYHYKGNRKLKLNGGAHEPISANL